MKKILVTGCNGQVGSELKELSSSNQEFEFNFTDRTNLDLGSRENILNFVADYKPDFIINTAAYTAVDKAEENQEMAELINAKAVQYLAEACEKNNVWLMHISSDYVYHLEIDRPLLENDKTEAKGAYAKSKLKGDEWLINSKIDYCLLRTSWVYSFYGNNFVKTMIRLGQERDVLKIVSDQIGSPTYAKDIAQTFLQMISKICASRNKDEYVGIYNYSNGGITNWADFARTIFEIKKIDCKVVETSTEDYGAPAPRPKWSVLDKSRIQKVFDIEIIDWETSLKHCIWRLNGNDPN